MAWKKVSLEKFAKDLGVDYAEIKEKQRLITLIVNARKEQGLSQAQLARKLGITQPRIAKIESGMGTRQISFDVLLKILSVLGFQYRVITKREKLAA
jgi:transcriptional regulator with XRE-family HTH domain